MATSALVARLARICFALVGGFSLIVPMLIMTLKGSEMLNLAMTSVSVVTFAIAIALSAPNVSNQELIAA